MKDGVTITRQGGEEECRPLVWQRYSAWGRILPRPGARLPALAVWALGTTVPS